MLTSQAQETTQCVFTVNHIDQIYTCNLQRLNTETAFDFVNLNGSHFVLPPRNDDDVERVNFANGRMLAAFPDMVFDRFPNMHSVHIAGNIQLQSFSIQRCERLLTLSVDGPASALTIMPNGVFAGCVNLEEIIIRRTGIGKFEENVFIDTPNLKRLIMPQNQIVNLLGGVFQSLKQLELLDIERNAIVSFEPQIFQGMNSLQILRCGQHHLRMWPIGIFANLPSLREIDVTLSGVRSILPGTFGSLPSLETLHLVGELHRLSAAIFSEPLPRLHTLIINRNQIEAVQRTFFNRMPALRTLMVAQNICINQDFPIITDMQPVLSAFETCFTNFEM